MINSLYDGPVQCDPVRRYILRRMTESVLGFARKPTALWLVLGRSPSPVACFRGLAALGRQPQLAFWLDSDQAWSVDDPIREKMQNRLEPDARAVRYN